MITFKTLAERLRRSLKPVTEFSPPAAGLYHYQREQGQEKARIHLRIETDGAGLLLVNASRAYHLNATAAHLAYLCLESASEAEIIRSLQNQYRVTESQAKQDIVGFHKTLEEIIRPDGACPVCDLQLETTAPFSDRPSAPYRMDLALTYRCNNDCSHCYNAMPRPRPELMTEEWKRILDRLWENRIPHIVFTGGEPTLRPDLVELIAHAQKNGQITGMNTNGRRLRDEAYLKTLVEAGLDHVQITLESHDPHIHDLMVQRQGAWEDTVAGIQNALKTRLFVMTNTTLLAHNASPQNLEKTLDFLAGLGVPTLGLNALIYSGNGLNVNSGIPESELPPLLNLARYSTEQHGQRLIWYTPTQYCHFDPIQLELGVKGCTAALYNMCVEPDGSVIPCQSYYEPLGNLLNDPWLAIWEHDLAISLRERKNLPAGCYACALLPECGGGCPLARMANQACVPQPISPFQFEALEKRR
ncbi:MAG: radical SAM protein [Anaerolineae bacterium]|nr:radical SAM protein [Anaerolineae bacterium]